MQMCKYINDIQIGGRARIFETTAYMNLNLEYMPEKTDLAPEILPSQKESSLPAMFQVVSFWEGRSSCYLKNNLAYEILPKYREASKPKQNGSFWGRFNSLSDIMP